MDLNRKTGSAGNLLSRFLRFRIGVPVISLRLGRTDILVVIALAAAACLAYFAAISLWGEGAIRLSISGRWFQSDGWRVFDDMTNFDANHSRDRVHPLFSLFAIGATTLIRAIVPVDPEGAIRIFNGIAFMTWCGLLYATMRIVGCKIVDAVLLTILAAVSAGSLFWFVLPETYVPGTVSILLCLFVVALATKRDWPLVLAAAGSLSFTITNWIAGLSIIAASRTVGRGIILAGLSLGLVLGGWTVGKIIYTHPSTFFLLPAVVQDEADYINNKDAGGIGTKLAGTLVSPIVVPDLQRTHEQPTGQLLSFQATAITSWASGNWLFLAAAGLWLLLLAASVPALLSRRDRLALALGMMLAGQLALHIIYGDETFLYALHFIPLLIMILAVAATTARARIMRPFVILLIMLAGVNNGMRLDEATREPVTGSDPRLERLGPLASSVALD